MKIAGTAIFCVFLGLLFGCSNTPINSAVINSSNPQKITITSREAPDFMAWKRAYDWLPFPLETAAINREGNRIVRENGIENPANHIGLEVAKSLSGKYGIEPIETSEKRMISWDTEDIVRHYPQGGLIVDVQTLNWGFRYNSKGNPFALEYKYRVFYFAQLRLLDSESKSKIAEGVCKITPKDDNHLFEKDQLTENSAQILKSELKLAAENCLRYLNENVINIENR